MINEDNIQSIRIMFARIFASSVITVSFSWRKYVEFILMLVRIIVTNISPVAK